MNISSALDKLYSLQKFGIKLGLKNILELLEYLSNPQNNIKTFHIAGTNGKGSTASFISSILMEYGYKTGLYTSPHFIRFNERIRINSVEISDEYIIRFMEDIDEFLGDVKPTFFEVTTALALKYFADCKTDYAVIETGLGGRLDATNSIMPLASIITSISLEHTEHLGNSLSEIAMEKAGIIKDKIPVFLGKLPVEAETMIKEVALKNNSKYYLLNDFIKNNSSTVDFVADNFIFKDIQTGLDGSFQKMNSSLAILTLLKTIGLNDPELIKKGLCNVKKNSGIQGRFEFYNSSPDIIFDSAHNPEGFEVFLSAFNNSGCSYSNRAVLFGVMKDKNISNMLKMLSEVFNEIFITTIDFQRAAGTEIIYSEAEKLNIKVTIIDDYTGFVENFKNRDKKDCLVVLGSMYVLGKIKEGLAVKMEKKS